MLALKNLGKIMSPLLVFLSPLFLAGCPQGSSCASSNASNQNSGQCSTGSAPGSTSSEFAISFLANLNEPGSYGNLAIDSSGKLFYLDGNAGNVMEIDPSGNQSVFASYGATGGPSTMAMDSKDNIYVAANATIVKVSPSGVTTPMGCGTDLQPALQMTVYSIVLPERNSDCLYDD